MDIPSPPEQALEQRLATLVLDVLIRAGLILAMAMLCYRVLSPFLTLMVWALILAVTLYPLHQSLASTIGGKQGLAATLLTLGYQIFMGWVAATPNAGQVQAESNTQSAR